MVYHVLSWLTVVYHHVSHCMAICMPYVAYMGANPHFQTNPDIQVSARLLPVCQAAVDSSDTFLSSTKEILGGCDPLCCMLVLSMLCVWVKTRTPK